MRTVNPVLFAEAPKLHTRRIQSSFSEILQETMKSANIRIQAAGPRPAL